MKSTLRRAILQRNRHKKLAMCDFSSLSFKAPGPFSVQIEIDIYVKAVTSGLSLTLGICPHHDVVFEKPAGTQRKVSWSL